MPKIRSERNVPQRKYIQPPKVTPIMVEMVMLSLPAMPSSSRENPTPRSMKVL